MRTVLAVDSFVSVAAGSQTEMVAVRVERAPLAVPEAHKAYTLQLSHTEFAAWGTPNAVKQRGRKLRDALLAHPGVAGVLNHLGGPLYVKLSESEAELISWETLCDTADKFIALDQGCPIGRISDPVASQPRPAAVLRLPVKVMAIISAFGIHSQNQEWELWRTAIEQARKAGMPVQLKLLVGDEQLRADIEAAIAGGLTDVEVAHVESTGNRVIRRIIEWDPNIVHFFCHGVADGEEPWLQLATASDFKSPDTAAGSVKIRAKELAGMATVLSNPWLVTFNCCSSGRAAKELHSLAHQVVSAGFPAAVGMVEAVAASDAHEFTGAFYAAAFRALRLAAATPVNGAARIPFEWGDAMNDARGAIDALHQHDSNNRREWTLPALYVRGIEPMQFERPVAPPRAVGAPAAPVLSPELLVAEQRLRARLAAEWLQSVREETTPERRRVIMERALSSVPRALWPNLDGTFSDDI